MKKERKKDKTRQDRRARTTDAQIVIRPEPKYDTKAD